MRELIYHTRDINLNYFEGPRNGPPILLLHGNMGRWQAFSPIIPELISNMHVFALDLRGHGKSSHVPGTYTLQYHLQDIISFINEKMGSPIVIFGISLGGMLGLMAAAHYPSLIQSIIVADSPLSQKTLKPIVESQRDFGLQIHHYLQTNQIKKLYEAINDDFSSESISRCDPDLLLATFDRYEEFLGAYAAEALFPLIQCPVLIMHGEEKLGSMISDDDMKQATALFPKLERYKLTGVGHSLLLKKEFVLDKVTKFLSLNLD